MKNRLSVSSKFVPQLFLAALGILSTISNAGDIGKFAVDGRSYVIGYKGDGTVVPFNQLVELYIRATDASDMRLSSKQAPLQDNQNKTVNENYQAGDVEKVTHESLMHESISKPQPILKKIEIRMPRHNHGMLLKPQIKTRGKFNFQITGVKLHMKGFWQITTYWLVGQENIIRDIKLNI